MRYRGRVDSNQKEIAEGLRKLGCSVSFTSNVGNGFPDLVVGFAGKNWLFEVKDGKKKQSARALTDSEVAFSEKWKGQYDVVTSLKEALKRMGMPTYE